MSSTVIVAGSRVLVRDRFGVLKQNPAVGTERDCAIRAARLWRDLDMDPGPPPVNLHQLKRRGQY